MHATDTHRGGGASGAEVDGGEVVTHLVRSITTVGGVADTKLAVKIRSPTLHSTIGRDGTRESSALARRDHVVTGRSHSEAPGVRCHCHVTRGADGHRTDEDADYHEESKPIHGSLFALDGRLDHRRITVPVRA
ncbi:MAG: hypothetical protein EBY07_05695 [Actinobacteria bacterium]|nr:hypothetical protein [Actinomycetota bacterium]